jgi:hypothetical protein
MAAGLRFIGIFTPRRHGMPQTQSSDRALTAKPQ